MKKRTIDLLHDLALAFGAGLAAAGILFVPVFVVALIANGGSLPAALIAVRAALLIAGALTLLVCAGILLWGSGAAKVREQTQWKNRFRCIGLTAAAFSAAAAVLSAAVVLDYLLYYFG